MAKAKTKPPASTSRPEAADEAPLVVRHYCQGIGDCHLLKFRGASGDSFWMLIDCGVHSSVAGGNQRIDEIVADIADVTGGHIDLVVVTHEHWDHVSGFLTAAERFGRMKVDQVWMAWTENPADPDAKALDKFRADALNTLQLAAERLDRHSYADRSRVAVRAGLNTLQGFSFGAAGEKVRSARDAAKALGKDGVRYLEPGTPPLDLPGVPGVKVYVLGPPRDTSLLKLTTKAGEMYGVSLAPGWKASQAMRAAAGLGDAEMQIDPFMPFGPEEGASLKLALSSAAEAPEGGVPNSIRKLFGSHYLNPSPLPAPLPANKAKLIADPDTSWQRIDDDWLYASAELALQFDTRTNNTSLVLAFELVDTGRVMLFAADAQIGNWLSWQKLDWSTQGLSVTGPELLARTVYLKVGHHGSENATPEGNGLEQMTDPDLSAFVPVNAADAAKVGWGRMPFRSILDRLHQKTSGRTIRADAGWLAASRLGPDAVKPGGSIQSIRHKPGLWVEVALK